MNKIRNILKKGRDKVKSTVKNLPGPFSKIKRLEDKLRESSEALEKVQIELKKYYTKFYWPGHFYSPLPDIEELKNNKRAFEKREIKAINLNKKSQLDLLHRFAKHYEQIPFPDEKKVGFRYNFKNPFYSYGDGTTLYNFMRELKPKKIIEIGSGFSSALMLDVNEKFFNNEIDLTFVEPYPDVLESLIPEKEQRKIVKKKIQDVDLSLFEKLEDGDILFVDSTHVSKVDSDVNQIIFEIFPRLKKGVYIHVHDIFHPFEYHKEWILEGRAWNEAYLLRAFLQFNDSFEIALWPNFMVEENEAWFKKNMPNYLINPGGSIWLRRIK